MNIEQFLLKNTVLHGDKKENLVKQKVPNDHDDIRKCLVLYM